MARSKSVTISKDMLDTGRPAVVEKRPKDYGAALNFRVPEDFLQSFKIACARRKLNQTELLIEGMTPILREFGDYE